MKEGSEFRITTRMGLIGAIEMVSSDKIRLKPEGKPARWIYTINPDVAKLLIRISGSNANLGWQTVYGCQALALYGSQILLAFNGYCNGDLAKFVQCVKDGDSEMIKWVDAARKTK
jgi:hypothetical protein